jgi:hypothetical protein
MQITNLIPSKYKRCFAFGCSFTKFHWPTWADIIGQDIPTYQNWGEIGAGNQFIFNSIIEADARFNFNRDDLVLIMWAAKEREDRYCNNYWQHDNIHSQQKTYGIDWVNQFALDTKGYLVRDLATIKAAHLFLDNTNCDWKNFIMCPITNISKDIAKKLGYTDALITNEQGWNLWVDVFDTLCDGGSIDPLLEHKEVIALYSDVFTNIDKSFEGRWSYKYKKSRSSPGNDAHPTPMESLEFIDKIWPDNMLSSSARNYAKDWNTTIFKDNIFPPKISLLEHTNITRL